MTVDKGASISFGSKVGMPLQIRYVTVNLDILR